MYFTHIIPHRHAVFNRFAGISRRRACRQFRSPHTTGKAIANSSIDAPRSEAPHVPDDSNSPRLFAVGGLVSLWQFQGSERRPAGFISVFRHNTAPAHATARGTSLPRRQGAHRARRPGQQRRGRIPQSCRRSGRRTADG